MIRSLFALAFAFAATPALAAGPCETAQHKQFNFWLGEWSVHTPAGRLAGTNSIKAEYGGCVIHERYTTPGPYSGESLNVYDATRKVWHQTWVDSTGTLLMLEGGLRGKSMVLEGQTTGTAGKPIKHRITWTPNADGTLRQLWQSTDEHDQWVTTFDGKYSKKK
jgi:hypothetical protein